MKISFDCDCILLQNSLELFLKDFIAHKKDCDFIISDRKIESKKPVFVIAANSAHLQVPFTKETLLSTLEEFYSAIQIPRASFKVEQRDENLALEEAISNLVDKFKKDLIALIKSYL